MAGRMKQLKGKVNDVVGAIRGDTGQQARGKVQKAVGKVKETLARNDRKSQREAKRSPTI